uniref:Uncharacterized protein n=1 Tax=Minutocellus polymorphus TaxID=265543 RepID=A0A7S0AQY6_9STRA|mmetsp:Transcript_19963/g.33026  ORF Transcript_19963/g.33026 Transcript_19963/m.33026 type:complete len:302 (+) Transcript_19963:86-991(+)
MNFQRRQYPSTDDTFTDMKLFVTINLVICLFANIASSVLAIVCEINDTSSCPEGQYCSSVACNNCTAPPECRPCTAGSRTCDESAYLYEHQGDLLSIQNCFEACIDEDLYCSDDAPSCPDGEYAAQWCGFQAGTNGYCLSCGAWDFSDFAEPYQCGLLTRNDKSRAECLTKCHTGCSSTADCTEDSFCAFDSESQGYCSSCDKRGSDRDHPRQCANYFFSDVDDGINDLTEAECLTTCFQPCTSDSDCGDEMKWNCTEYEDAGYCTPWGSSTSSSSHVFPYMCRFIAMCVALLSLLGGIML